MEVTDTADVGSPFFPQWLESSTNGLQEMPRTKKQTVIFPVITPAISNEDLYKTRQHKMKQDDANKLNRAFITNQVHFAFMRSNNFIGIATMTAPVKNGCDVRFGWLYRKIIALNKVLPSCNYSHMKEIEKPDAFLGQYQRIEASTSSLSVRATSCRRKGERGGTGVGVDLSETFSSRETIEIITTKEPMAVLDDREKTEPLFLLSKLKQDQGYNNQNEHPLRPAEACFNRPIEAFEITMTLAASVIAEPVIIDTVPYNRLRLLDEEQIGCGAFGAVYKAFHSDWGIQVAYKKLLVHNINNNRCQKTLKKEANIHRQLRHPNIVPMLGVVFEDGNYGLVLEYICCGSLDCFFENLNEVTGKNFTVSWKVKLSIAHEVCCGMSYLHSLSTPVIHCDLKRSNILLDERMNVKISDFGLSEWKNYSRSFSSVGKVLGTPSHVAPEMWKDSTADPTEMCDVYSFGILLWEILAEKIAFQKISLDMLRHLVVTGNRPPISHIPQDMLGHLVVTGNRPPISDIPQDVPLAVSTLVVRSWDNKPDNRRSFKELSSNFNQLITSFTTVTEVQKEKKLVLGLYNNLLTDLSEHGRKLARCREQLTKMLRRRDQILAILLEQRALTQIEFDDIRLSSTAPHEVINRLLDCLNKKTEEVFKSFLDALRRTNQHHLCELIENECFVLNINHKTVLRDNYTYLQDNMQATVSLLGHLLQVDVLDQHEIDIIKSKTTELEKTDQLLTFLSRTSQKDYELFLGALRKSKVTFIADKLQNHPH